MNPEPDLATCLCCGAPAVRLLLGWCSTCELCSGTECPRCGDEPDDGDDEPDDDGPACADCRHLGHICRPCHDDELAERRAEWAADRAEAGEYE